jgi:hypothetical protein
LDRGAKGIRSGIAIKKRHSLGENERIDSEEGGNVGMFLNRPLPARKHGTFQTAAERHHSAA